MQLVTKRKGDGAGVIDVPTSKSYANRALILAAITKGKYVIENCPDSTDVKNMISCLEAVGLKIQRDKATVTVYNSFPECEVQTSSPIYLHTGDGGTTNRFVIPLLCRGYNRYRLVATEKMKERPMQELFDVLESIGADVDHGPKGGDYWVEVAGPLNVPSEIEIDSSRTTQYASGLALAFADLNCEVIPMNIDSSQIYFDLTKKMVEDFNRCKFFLKIPVDFSSISYPFALALLCTELKISNCYFRDECQADSLFFELVQKIGGRFEWTKDGLLIFKNTNLKSFTYDCSQSPDLTPTLAFLASYCDGETSLENLHVLKYKESDRVAEIIRVLETFEVEYSYNSDEEKLLIKGDSNRIVEEKQFDPPSDHRIIMMAYLFMRMNNGGHISNAHHVEKSFPDFFRIMDSI